MKLRPGADGAPVHTRWRVYREMMLQIARTYPSIPDVRTMTLDQIEFFYEGIRGELEAMTKGSA